MKSFDKPWLIDQKPLLINIGFQKVRAWPTEWSDSNKKHAIAFLVWCPYCIKMNWFKLNQLYYAFDRSPKNFKCKHCKAGKRRFPTTKETNNPIKGNLFQPRTPGWRSI